MLGWWGPDGARRLVVATADPGALPDKVTWYLVTNLPRPGGGEAERPHPAAGLAEIVRVYGIRHWTDIRDWIDHWNEDPRLFTWTKTADEILNSLAEYMSKISGATH